MNISIITPYLPDLSSGSAVRAYHLLKSLALKNDVTLISADKTKPLVSQFKKEVHNKTYTFDINDINLIDRIRYYTQNKIPYVERLRHSTFNTMLKFIPKDTDILQITELFSYSIIEPYLNDLPGIKILDAHNIDYLRLKSEFDSSPLWRRIAGINIYNNLKKYEIEAVKKVDYVLTCSEQDRKIYSQYKDKKLIKVIPNGVEVSYFNAQINHEQKYSVLFMGLLSYSPNAKGLKWYIDKVHPILKKQYPDYKLVITGMYAPVWLQKISKQDKQIQLKGFVDDIRKEIARAQVCICPLFSGSGTRLKLLEYMAMSRPVVSTIKGAEGLDVKNNKNILLADNPNNFADSIINLINNKKLRIDIGRNGRKLVADEYNWYKITNKLDALYQKL